MEEKGPAFAVLSGTGVLTWTAGQPLGATPGGTRLQCPEEVSKARLPVY